MAQSYCNRIDPKYLKTDKIKNKEYGTIKNLILNLIPFKL